ncbi:D-Ala-D-Ala carboxypeptidase family metallohydrolase [Flavivirga abyssicola]|uniref:YcbK family protein n=1 Tax=Flavivirga abyssicola TaxID=3063533 RepID=UPI0026E067FD|nr:D-Ala-D-Ala carboxypeptidase family metallohydrolase [Flavivirga sp. MEBiC07777]WVK12670.1 D-Ala-D-Ala carboxypeptidase family metallohydrolase [Flavivirga sp. MEBiC07777]
MKLTTNFSKVEFESRDGFQMPDDILENIKELAENLQVVRDYLKEPIHINSGYRSPNHNSAIGGELDSQHLLGKAADFSVRNYTAKDISLIFERMINNGEIKQGGVGLYNGFVHYDIRGTKARWNYSSRYKDFW